MNITATNKATGEIIDLPADTPQQIVDAWRVAQEYVKTADKLKDQLKKLVPAIVGPSGISEPIGNYAFRISHIQRYQYDKAIMRRVLDEDVFDILLKPDKPAVDKYLKENLEPASTELRTTMIADGLPYPVIKLEKINREDQNEISNSQANALSV